jgi:hypothetical protein
LGEDFLAIIFLFFGADFLRACFFAAVRLGDAFLTELFFLATTFLGFAFLLFLLAMGAV